MSKEETPKSYRYFLQPKNIDWDLLPKKVRKKLEGKTLYLKKSLKFGVKKEKALSFPDLASGEQEAEKTVQKHLATCRERYGKDFDIDIVRAKKKKKPS